MSKLIDMTGQKIGRLLVLERAENDKDGKAMWKCRCDCGNDCVVLGAYLRNGNTKSCGCLWYDSIKASITKYGEYYTRLRHIWQGIKTRCYNKNEKFYNYYGGKGVKLCEEWKDFMTFKKWAIEIGYNDNLTIDRIDVNGDYCPENCRWVDQKSQCNNRSNNVLIEWNGQKKTLSQWCEMSPLTYKQVYPRYHNLKWSLEKSLFTPIKGGNKDV